VIAYCLSIVLLLFLTMLPNAISSGTRMSGTDSTYSFFMDDNVISLDQLLLDELLFDTYMSAIEHQGSQGRDNQIDDFEREAMEDLLRHPIDCFRVGVNDNIRRTTARNIGSDAGAQTSLSPDGEVATSSTDEQSEEFEQFLGGQFLLSVDVEDDLELGNNNTKVESEDVISNRLCSKLVSFCRGSPLSAMSPFECIHLFRCLITNDEFQAWTRRLNDLDTLRSNVRKRINKNISELAFYKCYLGIYDDPEANHRYSMEKPQKERKHAGKAIVFYVLSKFVEDPLSLDDQRRLFDGITTLKDLVSNRDEMGALFVVFRSLRAVGMLLSPDGNQKVFMVIGSMVLGDGVFHQRGGRHMTKKAKCLAAIVTALIEAIPSSEENPAERCRKRRRDGADGSSRSESGGVPSAEESTAEPSNKLRRAD
jgi:hypothetical protein